MQQPHIPKLISRKCIRCLEYEIYATPYYTHQYPGEVPYKSEVRQPCQPPRPFGQHVCWNCGKHESLCSADVYYHHDLTGRGRYTCIAPAPLGKIRCANCHGLYDSSEPYDPHYQEYDPPAETQDFSETQTGYWKCKKYQA
jgi:hypothetical protein